ncbi:glycoside hydrolase domain-containing protein [Niallia sp.]|uniref:glycoside hydrolase domain-containing protein n=1 Tax=Niallia sp. TaxID=2837523 RepID=UPI00289991AA|nr:glycoside hydrolase domain-containing protein [Niallia sp.]
MDWKKYLLIAAATFLILFSGIVTVLLIHTNSVEADKEPSNSVNSQGSATTESSQGNVNISVTNNIQNIVSGESKATIENKVSNDIKDKAASIDNKIDNKTENEASATINNAIENLLKGQVNGTTNNTITNNILSNNKAKLANQILNDLDLTVDVNVTNELNTNGKQETTNNDNGDTNSNEDNAGNEDNANNGNSSDEKTENNSETSYLWGIDSASETTEDFYACVRENFGDPKIVARYLGTNDGVSHGLTTEQMELIHSKKADVLLIYNGFTDATGYDNGVNEAKKAITLANDLGAPDGVAIFGDIEPNYPVDAGFIEGWYDEISKSSYEPAIYGIFDSGEALTNAFNKAVENKGEINENTYLWSASPNIGITTEADAPAYKVDAPEDSLAYGWQYGIEDETCNIDTNLFDSNLTEVLWKH